MSTVRDSIDVAVPVRVAYERMCRFEDFPRFRPGVRQVSPPIGDLAHWAMDLDNSHTEFKARITDRRPDELLTWQAVDGPRLVETVRFVELTDDRTRIVAELDVDAQRLLTTDTHAQEWLMRWLKADLIGLKEYIEHDTPAARTRSQLPREDTYGDFDDEF
jgi:uncharacterized membrane protein